MQIKGRKKWRSRRRVEKNDGLYPLQMCPRVFDQVHTQKEEQGEKVKKKNKEIANAIVMQF